MAGIVLRRHLCYFRRQLAGAIRGISVHSNSTGGVRAAARVDGVDTLAGAEDTGEAVVPSA